MRFTGRSAWQLIMSAAQRHRFAPASCGDTLNGMRSDVSAAHP